MTTISKPVCNQRNIVHYIDMDKPVDVYRNLHTGLWSVRQGGLVRCYIDRLFLFSCKLVVSQKGRERVLEEGRKNVHAVIRGRVVPDKDVHMVNDVLAKTGVKCFDVTYNPYKHESFMGYYEEGAPDLFTPIPISRQVAEENLARVGASRDDFEIVVGLSEDDEVQSHLRDRRFDVVVIDGDHSYDGVRRDFENYAGHIVEGGYLIVDDYRGPSWPEVTRYVDETIFVDQRFEVVTGELRTAVVRRIS